jgi:biopolymer transport protein ExbD
MLRKQSVNIRHKLKLIKGKPDLTPLVDVLFLLLIFFMLSSSFVQVSGISVNLPGTATSSSQGTVKLVLTVDKEGRIYFNDEEVIDFRNLEKRKFGFDRLKEKLMDVNVGTVIIRADRETQFGIVAKLMALTEEVGLDAFILTMPETNSEELAEPATD